MMKNILILVTVFIVGVVAGYSSHFFMQPATAKASVTQAAEETIGVPSVQEREQTETTPSVPVKVALVGQEDISLTHTFYGTAAPYSRLNVQGKHSGKITYLKGKEGDDIKKGDVLVRFDDSDTQLQLQQAMAAKNAALESIKQAQLAFETLQRDVERQEQLFKEGIVAQKTLDDLRNQLDGAQATLNSAQENVKGLDAEIAMLHNVLKDLKIVAPMSGVIAEKRYNVNEVYQAGDVLYEMVELHNIALKIEVPETYISDVREDMPLTVAFDSLEGQQFEGMVERIVPRGDTQSRNFLVKAIVKNPERIIKSGMFARVLIEFDRIPEALIVEQRAIFREGNGHYVFKVVDDHVKKIAVDIKERRDTTAVLISQELTSTDRVVTHDISRLQDNTRISIL